MLLCIYICTGLLHKKTKKNINIVQNPKFLSVLALGLEAAFLVLVAVGPVEPEHNRAEVRIPDQVSLVVPPPEVIKEQGKSEGQGGPDGLDHQLQDLPVGVVDGPPQDEQHYAHDLPLQSLEVLRQAHVPRVEDHAVTLKINAM